MIIKLIKPKLIITQNHSACFKNYIIGSTYDKKKSGAMAALSEGRCPLVGVMKR